METILLLNFFNTFYFSFNFNNEQKKTFKNGSMKQFIKVLLIIYLTTSVYNKVITITDENFNK